MASSPITSWQIDGETVETVTDFGFLGSKITSDGNYRHEIKRHFLLGKKVLSKARQHIKKQRHHFANKGLSSQSYGFSSSHVWMWELNCKESWAPKNWCFCTVVLEMTLESPLNCKEMQPVLPKGKKSWIFIGRSDAQAETVMLSPPEVKSRLIKDTDAGKNWRQEAKETTEDKMVGWPPLLNGYEFEQAPGADVGQGSLVCCSLWSHKESDMTERLNNSNIYMVYL